MQHVANVVAMPLMLVLNINYTKDKNIIPNVSAVGHVIYKSTKVNNSLNYVATLNGKTRPIRWIVFLSKSLLFVSSVLNVMMKANRNLLIINLSNYINASNVTKQSRKRKRSPTTKTIPITTIASNAIDVASV